MTKVADVYEVNFQIDKRLDSYNSFYDGEWAKQIWEIGKNTKVEEPVFNLCINWKSSINAQALPWLLVKSLSSLQRGHLEAIELIPSPFLEVLEKQILARIRLKYKEKKELKAILSETAGRMDEALNQAKNELIATEMQGPNLFWEQFIQDAPAYLEFSLAVWGSQRECFSSMFHSYEDFIRDLIALAKNKPNYRASGFDTLKNDFSDHFGEDTCDFCLTDQAVDISKKVRNRLAHNGGRISTELRSLDHGIVIQSDVFQIMPPDNQKLYNLLKDRALKLAEVAAGLPEMQMSQAVA